MASNLITSLLVVASGAPSSVLAPNSDGLIACDHCDHEVDGEKAAIKRESSETGFGGVALRNKFSSRTVCTGQWSLCASNGSYEEAQLFMF